MHRKTPEFSAPGTGDPALGHPGAHRPGDWRPYPSLDAATHGLGTPAASRPLTAAAAVLTGQTPSRMTALWSGLGLVSAAYLGIIVWQQTQAVDAALVPVTESLERLASDIADLKQATAAIDARERLTATRLSAAELRLDGGALVVGNQVPPEATAPALRGQRPTNRMALVNPDAPATIEAGSAAVAAAVAPKKSIAAAKPAPVAVPAPAATKPWATGRTTGAATPAPAVNPMQTGSIAPPPAASGNQGLMIASGPSLESIRLSWTVLKLNHGEVLGALEPRFVPSGDGSAFNLIAGPFGSDAEAQKACGALKAHGVGCKATEYTGGAL